jgi:hypothetical protein
VAAQSVASAHRRPASASCGAPFDRLVAQMQAHSATLCEMVLERLGQRFPSWEAESAFSREQVTSFVERSLHAQLRALAEDTLPRSAPEVDATAARTVARVGELSAFLAGYRAAQAALWETWFCLIEDSGLQGDERRALLSRGSDFFFRYADLLGDYLTAIYEQERAALRSDRAQRLFGSVKALLEGEQPSHNGLEIELHRHHLGLIAWGEGCTEVARALAGELGRPLFLVSPLEQTCWAWVSGSRPIESSLARRLARFAVPEGVRLSLGTEEFGEEGFRATHRQAQRARLLADSGTPLTHYADIAVEALASENSQEARRFVVRELGAIDDDSQTSRRLRDTLSAYFAAEHNAASAAATLGVHQQTVANRLRAAEERLGQSVGARRVELEMALRLRRKLVAEAS